MTKYHRAQPPPIFCHHCNTEIEVKAVKACLRKTCKTKAKLKERDK